MSGSAWSSIRLFLEAESQKKGRRRRGESPSIQAADAMTSNDDARRMIWRVLEPGEPRDLMAALTSRGWKRGRVGIYDLLWHPDEWRLLSAPTGSGLGRSIEAVFSLFEPISSDAQKLYGWRNRDDSDRPSQGFIDWAAATLPRMQRFANALPKYTAARLEPVSAWGSNPNTVISRSHAEKPAALPTIMFQRDGSFVLRGADGREVVGAGRITVDPGQLVAHGDEGGDDDWLAGGSPVRARGARSSMRRVGGRVTGDGSLTAALDRLVNRHTPGVSKGGGRASWAQLDQVVLTSSSTSPGESQTPHAAVRRAFTGEDMANVWAASQTPFPPGIWKVAELRKMLRMVARETGETL